MKNLMALAFILTMTNLARAQERDIQKFEYAAETKLIQATIELASSVVLCKENSDCKAIAFGEKACGGPLGYTFTSKLNLNLEEVEFLSQKTIERGKYLNQKYSRFSNCAIESEPELECIQNFCVEKQF